MFKKLVVDSNSHAVKRLNKKQNKSLVGLYYTINTLAVGSNYSLVSKITCV